MIEAKLLTNELQLLLKFVTHIKDGAMISVTPILVNRKENEKADKAFMKTSANCKFERTAFVLQYL